MLDNRCQIRFLFTELHAVLNAGITADTLSAASVLVTLYMCMAGSYIYYRAGVDVVDRVN